MPLLRYPPLEKGLRPCYALSSETDIAVVSFFCSFFPTYTGERLEGSGSHTCQTDSQKEHVQNCNISVQDMIISDIPIPLSLTI